MCRNLVIDDDSTIRTAEAVEHTPSGELYTLLVSP